MKRIPIKKVSKNMSAQKHQEKKLTAQLIIRSGGFCEQCHTKGDWRGLSLSHTDPKGMGGTSHVYTLDEVQLLCMPCHVKMHHQRELPQ